MHKKSVVIIVAKSQPSFLMQELPANGNFKFIWWKPAKKAIMAPVKNTRWEMQMLKILFWDKTSPDSH